MNNANFAVDCRNSSNNCLFEPIIDEINEASYLKKYYNLFDKKISNFVDSKLLKKETERKFEQKLANVKDDDSFKMSRITAINNEKNREVDALEAFKENEKNKKGKEQKMLVKKLKNTIKVKKLRLRLILIKMNVIA